VYYGERVGWQPGALGGRQVGEAFGDGRAGGRDVLSAVWLVGSDGFRIVTGLTLSAGAAAKGTEGACWVSGSRGKAGVGEDGTAELFHCGSACRGSIESRNDSRGL